MRRLVTVLFFIMATTAAQAKQDEDVRHRGGPKDPPKASVTNPDRSLSPQESHDKGRTKSVETLIPDICKGC